MTQYFERERNEYKRRVQSLIDDGYHLMFDTSKSLWIPTWAAYLVHHNGNKVRILCNTYNGHVWQTTNGKKVYDNRDKAMCKS